MTVHTSITTNPPGEVPRATPVSAAFPGLLACVHALIAAERDFEEVGFSFDPAYSEWVRDTEEAHEQLTAELERFHTLPRTIPEDRPLQRMAQQIDAMLGSEEPGRARKLRDRMLLAFFTRFQVHGIGPTAMQRNVMLVRALHLTIAMCALPLFDGAPEVIEDDGDEEDEDPDSDRIFGP